MKGEAKFNSVTSKDQIDIRVSPQKQLDSFSTEHQPKHQTMYLAKKSTGSLGSLDQSSLPKKGTVYSKQSVLESDYISLKGEEVVLQPRLKKADQTANSQTNKIVILDNDQFLKNLFKLAQTKDG